jgi:hypothetical protein
VRPEAGSKEERVDPLSLDGRGTRTQGMPRGSRGESEGSAVAVASALGSRLASSSSSFYALCFISVGAGWRLAHGAGPRS